MSSVLIAGVLVLTACTFDTSSRLGSYSQSDAADVKASPDGDIRVSETGTVASNTTMVPIPTDAAVPDAEPDAEQMPVSCSAAYGTASGYQLCDSTPTSCAFYVVTNEDTCNNLCASLGGSCIESYDSDCSAVTSYQGCTPVHYNQVCVCSR